MKKLLSVVLVLMLVLSALPTFAADSEAVAVSFDHTIEGYRAVGNETRITEGYMVTAGVPAVAAGNKTSTYISGRGNFAVYKVELPAVAEGEGYEHFILGFGCGVTGSVFKMPGEDWDFEKTLANTDWYKAITVASTAEAYKANDADVLVEETGAYKNNLADITTYANECLNAGQTYMYLAVGGWNSTSNTTLPTMTDSTYVAARNYPLYYYSIGEAVETDPLPGQPDDEPEDEPEVPFDQTLEGYRGVGNKTKITEGYMVTAGVPAVAAGNKMSTYMSGKGHFAIYKITLPAVAEDEGYEHFILSFGCGAGPVVRMMPGEDWDFENTLAETDWYKAITVAATSEEYKANDADIITEENSYFNIRLADITTYANQCLNAGQTYMYLAVGSWSSTANTTLPTMTDSSYLAAGCNPHYYYSIGEKVEPEPEPEVPFEHTIAGYQAVGNLTKVPESYTVSGGAVSAASGNWAQGTYMSGKGNFAIYKIPVPQAPAGKEINHVILRFGGSKNPMRVFKMPGTDWDLTKSLADTDWYKAVTVAATSEAYYANDADILIEEGTSYNNYYADITTYVKECALAGQEYFYVVATAWNSTSNVGLSTMTDSTYVAAGHNPQYYYSFAEKKIKFLSASVNDGAYVADVDAPIDFEFTDVVESAVATINGTPVDAAIDGRKVAVNGINKGVANVITVTATDAAGNEATATITVTGYGKASLTKSTYAVSAAGSKASTYNPSASYVTSIIFQIPLPEVADGKEINSFIFNFITPKVEGRYYHLVKLPGEDWDVENLVQTEGDVAEGLTNIWSFTQDPVSYKYVNKATRANIISERVDIAPSAVTEDGKSYMNYANLSQYARECIANGQSTMWLAVRSDSTVAITGVGDSSHAAAGRFHTVTWTLKDADETIAAPKAVAAADEAAYDEASAQTVLAKDTEYKFITKANIKGQLVVAQYDANGKFVSVDAVELDGTGADASTKAFKTGTEEGFVKVFVWATDKMAPVDDDITVLAIK